MDELGNTRKRDRDFVTDDLRRNQDIDYAHNKMLLRIFDSFPPAGRNRGEANFIEETSIPRNLLKYKIDFPTINGVTPPPDQNTAYAISEQLPIASPNALAFRPNICLDLTRKPWVPPIIERQRAIEASWTAVRNYPNHQSASTQRYLLYHTAFVFYFRRISLMISILLVDLWPNLITLEFYWIVRLSIPRRSPLLTTDIYTTNFRIMRANERRRSVISHYYPTNISILIVTYRIRYNQRVNRKKGDEKERARLMAAMERPSILPPPARLLLEKLPTLIPLRRRR